MTLTPEQQKRFDEFWIKVENKEFADNQLQNFIASELQRERERFLMALHESENIFFREHDLKPCGCLMRHVERRLNS
jgi:hypothetical protein